MLRPMVLATMACLVWGCSEDQSVGELPDCTVWVTKTEVSFTHVDRVDVLLVIDDSPSMKEEQEKLREQLPAMMTRLVSGLREGEDVGEPLRDLHVGVVSSDLGATGAQAAAQGCGEPLGGDGARLLHDPIGEGCQDSYPAFLSASSRLPTVHPLIGPALPDASAIASDLLCIGALGTGGCAYSQPLEAALTAVSPDVNEGFLRNDPEAGLSLVVVVVITDQDDCSVLGPGVFDVGRGALAPAAHCAEHAESLSSVERYLDGLKALRPGSEQLVMFAAIAGVPPDATDDEARAELDWNDASAREAFYARLGDHPLAQTTVEIDGTLRPGCDSQAARATPAPRLVEVARGFGSNGTVRSICADDWTKVFDDLELGRWRLHGPGAGACLPRPLPRDDRGLVPCVVTWELPRAGTEPDGTPVACDQLPSLSPHPDRPISDAGGAVCVVRQLVVSGLPEEPALEPGAGWFYDDFSTEPRRDCTGATQQELFFTPTLPPNGVTVAIECVDERIADGGPGVCGEL